LRRIGKLGDLGLPRSILELNMRNRDLLRLAGAAVLASASLLSFSTSASAFSGLSDKQKAHIEEYIHCKILLLTDLAAFEAEQPPCGGNPNVGIHSIIGSPGSGAPDRCEYENGTDSLVYENGDYEYCPK
jgi:hypothetical protein